MRDGSGERASGSSMNSIHRSDAGDIGSDVDTDDSDHEPLRFPTRSRLSSTARDSRTSLNQVQVLAFDCIKTLPHHYGVFLYKTTFVSEV